MSTSEVHVVGELLTGIGITGVPALALLGIAWIVARMTERVAVQRDAQFGSHLRQLEARLNASLQARTTLDVDLRTRRVDAYTSLWSLGAVVSRWPRNTDLTHTALDTLHLQLRDWYYSDTGGLWLSTPAREAYGKLQEELEKPRAGRGSEAVDVDGPDYDRIVHAFSRLRTELTHDLQSRLRLDTTTEAE